jgi:ATP phosphoribosyltransferase
MTSRILRIAIPSKGSLEQETLDFLRGCGLAVHRPNPRQYNATLSGVDGAVVLFQRAADIPAKVEEGTVDLGITGYDIVSESRHEADDLMVLLEDLGFGHCELVLAVPEAWIDVWSIGDLADLSNEMRSQGRHLRVVTKFPNLVKDFLYRNGVNFFTLTEASGALEAAPRLGYADVVADIVETGTTLRENRLKTISGGTILRSQACLIGSRSQLKDNLVKLSVLRHILELMEARLRAKKYRTVTANIRGPSAEAVAAHILQEMDIAGMKGPTISKVYAKELHEPDWFAVNLIVRADLLQKAIDHLRKSGGSGITVVSADYVFDVKSWAFESAVRELYGDNAESFDSHNQ